MAQLDVVDTMANKDREESWQRLRLSSPFEDHVCQLNVVPLNAPERLNESGDHM